MSSLSCLNDFKSRAESRLDSNAWGYYSSGANQLQTLNDNEEAFHRYRLRPRVLKDVSYVNTKTSILGEEVSFPVGVGATGIHRMAHSDGELATVRATTKAEICMMLSSWSSTSIEDVAEAGKSGLRWFQLNVFRDRELTKSLIQRAEKAGYKAIVLTVDQPVIGRRIYGSFTRPQHIRFPIFGDKANPVVAEDAVKLLDPSITWEVITWIRGITQLPIIIKGILTAEDAIESIKHDVQGIIVSNHGGRQLDGVLATIDALSEVVRAVEGRVEVYMDGGVRQGTDVLKALALGARAVFIGKPAIWGLAYNGEEGVTEVLEILREEFKSAMMLSGCRSVSDIKSSLIVRK